MPEFLKQWLENLSNEQADALLEWLVWEDRTDLAMLTALTDTHDLSLKVGVHTPAQMTEVMPGIFAVNLADGPEAIHEALRQTVGE